MRAVPVLSAAQAAATDAATIAGGTPSLELMERAGAAAARIILERYGESLGGGVRIHAGGGNNGGDGWVVARHLAGHAVPVSVAVAAEPATADARTMRDRAAGLTSEPAGRPDLCVDALLGTGARGAPRGTIADGVRELRAARAAGARIVALDVPSGLDATTGEATLVAPAHCTITFGSIKRGQLLARHLVGALIAVDIGLGESTGEGVRAELVTPEWVRGSLPPIPPDAHKGTRRRLAIIGGAAGMAGAVILAARSALRSGGGMVRAVVERASITPVQAAAPAALAGHWPESDEEAAAMLSWADGVLIGPGLGATDATRALVERVLRAAPGRPVTLDADGLNVFRDDAEALGDQLRGRAALITPHAAEASRLARCDVSGILARRFEVAGELARRTGAGVLLKGVPTVIADGAGTTMVSARGTAALATAGSGDVLAGIAATLLMQLEDPLRAGACAAFVHGRAAEMAGPPGAVRGVDLEDVISALGPAWWSWPAPAAAPVLAELPSLGEGM